MLEPYTKAELPDQKLVFALKPRLAAWTARVWRESPATSQPLVALDARIDSREVGDHALAEVLKPYAAALQLIKIYLVHGDKVQPVAPWAVGNFDVAHDRAYMFFYDFLGASNGALMLQLLQTAGAQTDMIMSVIPVRMEAQRIVFAITDYDFGIHNRIG
jgi:hypothetical protein